MIHFTSFPTSTTANSSSGQDHQFQQNSWHFDYLEDRTSVTYPSVASEISSEFTASQISYVRETRLIRSLQKYWRLLDEILQEPAVSRQNWRYLERNWHISSGSPDDFQGLVKTLPEWSEQRTSASPLIEIQIHQIEKLYILRDDIEVKDILREHPFLLQLLLDTYSKIEAHFLDAQVFLDAAVDYEASDSYSGAVNNDKELIVSISTPLSPKEAIEALKNFYIQWWFTASKNAKDRISIGLEYQ